MELGWHRRKFKGTNGAPAISARTPAYIARQSLHYTHTLQDCHYTTRPNECRWCTTVPLSEQHCSRLLAAVFCSRDFEPFKQLRSPHPGPAVVLTTLQARAVLATMGLQTTSIWVLLAAQGPWTLDSNPTDHRRGVDAANAAASLRIRSSLTIDLKEMQKMSACPLSLQASSPYL